MTNQRELPVRRGDPINSPASWGPSPAILKIGIAALLVGAIAALIALRVFAPEQGMRAIGPVMVALVAAAGWWLHTRGRFLAAKNLLSYGLWTVLTMISIVTGGVHAPVAIIYPVLILMSGWLINVRTALVMGGLTVAATAGFVLAESGGWLPAASGSLPWLYGVVQIVVYLLSAVLIVMLVRAYKSRLDDLSRVGADLQRAQAVANTGSWEFDIVHDTMQLSVETCRIFGLPAGTKGSHGAYLARVHPQDRAAVDCAWQEAFKGKVFDHEHRIQAGDTIRWIRQKAVLEFAGDGTPLAAVGITQDITERKQADERITELAFFDQLTGLPNRTLLFDRLEQAITVSQRSGSYGALVFIDLDNFKNLNDTRGHDMGDALLKQVAQRLSACVRADDTVARLGGDEFVVMLPSVSTNRSEAATLTEVVGEKILVTLNQHYQLDSCQHHSTPSIGVTLFGGDEHEPIEEPLKRADLAMYQAKAAGRNTLRFFDPSMQTVATNRAALELGLREALVQGEFVLFYQPQLTGEARITGAEALVRWQHPQRGLISPAEFIALAEETGQILPLGHWVLNAACTQLALWAGRAQLSGLTVAVNVSARQFHQSDFVQGVLEVLERTGANPHQLKLELTESVLLSNVQDVIAKMSALKARGVGFALDDFGTGYSSLSNLSRLPLDQLKIDRSFVMDIETNQNAAAICAATISLAHSLRLKVVAEGVETEAQRHFLHAVHRCDSIQGYLFSRPLPLDQFEAFVQDV